MEILKKIGRYFKNLFYTIIGKEVKPEDKEVEEEKYTDFLLKITSNE
jgi:hypothetical protein